jgi:hypothetical protein
LEVLHVGLDAEANVFADRCFRREKLARDRTVNDHDLRVLLVIRCSKVAAGDERDAECPEEAWRDGDAGNGHFIRCIFI